MRIGVVLPMAVSDGPGQVPTWPQVRTFGQHAEAVGFGGSVDELARAIDAHERLGFDDLIVQLAPKTTRSLDRLAEALELRAH
jgi:hypothetical protein